MKFLELIKNDFNYAYGKIYLPLECPFNSFLIGLFRFFKSFAYSLNIYIDFLW